MPTRAAAATAETNAVLDLDIVFLLRWAHASQTRDGHSR